MFQYLVLFRIFELMGHLKLYDLNASRESIVAEREETYLNCSSEKKILALLRLNHISVQMNGGNPLKIPLGKGIVIRKPNV